MAQKSLVGISIRKYRTMTGLSQDALSKRSGLAFHTISKIESGMTPNPKIDTIRKIASALKVSLADLINEPDQK